MTHKVLKLSIIIFLSFLTSGIYAQVCSVTPAIFLDGKDVTGMTLELCITGVNNLSASAPNSTISETAQWAQTGTSVTGVTGTAPNHGAITKVTAGITELTWTITSPILGCPPASAKTTLIIHNEPIATFTSISTRDACQDATQITMTTAQIGVTDIGKWVSTVKPKATTANNWTLYGPNLTIGNNSLIWEVDNLGCAAKQAIDNIKIESVVTPTISLNMTRILCYGASVNYLATPTNGGANPSFEWDFDGDALSASTSNQPIFTVNNIQSSGLVSVKMTSSNECARPKTASVSVQLNAVPVPLPVLHAEGDSTICVLSPICITARDNALLTNTSYRWFRDGIPLAETSLRLENVNISGRYSLNADNGVCPEIQSSNSLYLNVRQVPLIDVNVGGENSIRSCGGANITLNGAHTGLEAAWSAGEFNSSFFYNTDLKTKFLTEDKEGEYWVTLTATDGPCIARDSLRIIVNNNPTNTRNDVNDGDKSEWSENKVSLTENGSELLVNYSGLTNGDKNNNFSWNFDCPLDLKTNSAVRFEVETTNNFTLQVSLTDALGKSTNGSLAKPILKKITSNASGTKTTYELSYGDAFYDRLSSGCTVNPCKVDASKITKITFSISPEESSDKNGSFKMDNIEIGLQETPIGCQPTITKKGASICKEEVNLSVLEAEGFSYQWSYQTLANKIIGATNNSYTALLDGKYILTYTSNSCSGNIETNVIYGENSPTIFNNSGALFLTSTPGVSYQWYVVLPDASLRAIVGATSLSYKAVFNGKYQLLVSYGSCKLMSNTQSVGNTNNGEVFRVGLEMTADEIWIPEFAESSLSVYPNPAQSEQVNIDFSSYNTSDFKFQLMDSKGVILVEKQLAHTNYLETIQLSGLELSQGIYMAQVTQEGKILTERILIY